MRNESECVQWEMVQAVHRRHFYSSGRFGSLITDIEVPPPPLRPAKGRAALVGRHRCASGAARYGKAKGSAPGAFES